MNIYTGRGDFGNTNVIGGGTVKKSDSLVHAYGEVDELNSNVGLLSERIREKFVYNNRLEYYSEYKDEIIGLLNEIKEIQNDLFDVGSILSDPKNKMNMTVSVSRIAFLEEAIDKYQSQLEELKYFIIPNGSVPASTAQIVRAVTRRTERAITKAYEEESRTASPEMFIYMNRLSDYFFSVGRFLNKIDDYKDSYYKGTGEVFH